MGGWTLSPQQDFADASRDAGPHGGRTWVPPELPGVAPWSGENRGPDSAPGDVAQTDEPMQIASIETKGDNSSGYGPLDFGQNDNNSGNGNFFGLFSSNGGNPGFGGGQGGSWNGTFNPNGGGRPGGFASYSGGAGGAGGGGVGGDDDVCKGPNAKNFEKCLPKKNLSFVPPKDDDKKDDNTSPKDSTPTQNEDPPGNGGDNPGQGGDNPGQGGDNPGQGGDNPGQGGDNPGQGGDNPGQGGDNPGQGGDNPGQGGDNPGQGGDNPDQGGPHGGDLPTQIIVQDPIPVPEPGALLMSLAALLGLGWSVRRRA
jgi:hypothetical protein